MTSEPRTPSTPQSLAQLRTAIVGRHQDDGHGRCTGCWCRDELAEWPCDAYELATLLSVENVAAAMKATAHGFGYATSADWAAALLEAIGASHD